MQSNADIMRSAWAIKHAAGSGKTMSEAMRMAWANARKAAPESGKMTEAEYRAHPGVNKSTLWEMRKSPAHYQHIMDTPREDSPALAFGRAVHKLVLQPETFTEEYAVAPSGIDRRTKTGREAWEAFTAKAGAREILTAEDFETAKAMAAAVHLNPAARPLLQGKEFERVLFWNDEATGTACKCRCDAVGPGVVVDYKTCTDASTDAFARDAMRYGYDLQAAMYTSGARANGYGLGIDWYFIAQEKAPPYAVNVIRAGDAFIERGYWWMQELLRRYEACKNAGSWPGYNAGSEPNEIILPEWAAIPEV